MKAQEVLLALLISISLFFQVATSQKIIGVSPEEEAAYSGEFFQCPESKEIIPRASINDDFCDCKDGSDEPGTSACSSITSKGFFCRNKGYKSKYIFTSQVNDGICDCCDGSDEYFSFGKKCENTCLEQGKGEIQSMRNEIAKHREGAKVRREYIIKAQNSKPQLLNTIHELETRLSQKQKEYDEVKAKEEELKILNNEAKDILDDSSEDFIREDEEVDDEEKRERRGDEELLQKRAEFKAKHNLTPDEAHKMHSDAKAATRRIKNEVDDLENELKSKNAIAKTDFGEHSEYYALTEEKIEYHTHEYKYELHPFSKVLQGSTDMGTWDSWKNGYSEMHYHKGRKCWGAGDRETTVYLHCGLTNEITDVSEPSTCVYSMQFYTPIACSEEYAKQLEDHINDLLGVEITADLH